MRRRTPREPRPWWVPVVNYLLPKGWHVRRAKLSAVVRPGSLEVGDIMGTAPLSPSLLSTPPVAKALAGVEPAIARRLRKLQDDVAFNDAQLGVGSGAPAEPAPSAPQDVTLSAEQVAAETQRLAALPPDDPWSAGMTPSDEPTA